MTSLIAVATSLAGNLFGNSFVQGASGVSGVSFTGTATSVMFGLGASQYLYGDLTFGSAVPLIAPVPEPTMQLVVLSALACLWLSRDQRTKNLSGRKSVYLIVFHRALRACQTLVLFSVLKPGWIKVFVVVDPTKFAMSRDVHCGSVVCMVLDACTLARVDAPLFSRERDTAAVQ